MQASAPSQIRDRFDDCARKSQIVRLSSIKDRRNKLKKLEKWILTQRSAIAKAVYEDLKKPERETDLTEIFVVLTEIRTARRMLKEWMSPKPVSTPIIFLGTRAYEYPEPKGTCLIISPWNYPFQLAVVPLIAAIAAGNTVMIKPSEFSENTSALLKKMCDQVFEPDEVAVVNGAVDVAKKLLSLPFNHIFFTGSPQVGKIVMESASKHLASVTLELGGKSPVIVDQTANIKDAAEKIAWGKWQNAGQVCVAPDYLLVHEKVTDKLIGELSVKSTKLYGDSENYAAIINRNHHNRINDLMADAIDKGADIAFGGKSDRKELRFTPTALTNVSMESRLMTEEIFGPILPVISFSELSEAISIIQQKEKALALYIFSGSKKNIEKVKKHTSSGMLTINDCVIQFAHPNLPIGGVNHSGTGKSHGYHGFLAFSNLKAILKQRVGLTISKLVYPPYKPVKNLIINLVIKYF